MNINDKKDVGNHQEHVNLRHIEHRVSTYINPKFLVRKSWWNKEAILDSNYLSWY